MLLLELKKEKDNITNEERGQISLRLFDEYRDINGVWKKSTLMKFLHSYYGIERGDELLDEFWNNSHILLGEKDCVVKIVFTNDFPVNNFIKFLNKTKPQLKTELKEIQEFNKIDELKHMYLSTIALENVTYT